ncbi:MAG: TonB family protein [Bacteroidota bacterium]|jgi:TonB family protein|nr:MAG: hypothetical protein DIU61_07615 [Bacteroidota bacterium]
MADYRDDIERYLRGDMTPAEMHALEKKALDDPFFADALEGAATITPDEFASDINALKARVARRTRLSRGVPWYYQVAAAVLLVGVSAVMIFYLSGREDTAESIALNTPTQRDALPTPPASDSLESMQVEEDAVSSVEKDADLQAPRDFREELPVTPKETGESKRIESEKLKEDRVDQSLALDIAREKEAAPQVEDTPAGPAVAQEQKAAAARIEPQALRAAKADSRTVSGKVVRGRVIDAEDGLPLPGVNVAVKGAETGTVTDLNGYYEITVPEIAQTLVFSFIGLNSLETPVPEGTADAASLDVTLTPDVASLSEVVVTGYGNESERGFEEIKWEPAEPEGGKRAFRRYLEANLKYPKLAMENGIEGKVTVAFTIEPSGDLTDFRVIRGLGYGCDEEVIRLIREGPRWKPTKRNDEPVRGKARVKLKFDLPDRSK